MGNQTEEVQIAGVFFLKISNAYCKKRLQGLGSFSHRKRNICIQICFSNPDVANLSITHSLAIVTSKENRQSTSEEVKGCITSPGDQSTFPLETNAVNSVFTFNNLHKKVN